MDPWAAYRARQAMARGGCAGHSDFTLSGTSAQGLGSLRQEGASCPSLEAAQGFGQANSFVASSGPPWMADPQLPQDFRGWQSFRQTPNGMEFGPCGFQPNMACGSNFGNAATSAAPFLATGTPLRTTMMPNTFQGVPQSNVPNPMARSGPSSPPTFTSAAAAAASLGAQYANNTVSAPSSSAKVSSAFEVLGVGPPARQAVNLDQGERFIQAISGEKRPIPSWNGQPATMRSWLKLLAYWEIESTVPREKWGLRLYQSFPEGSKPRQIADQIGMQELLSPDGYSLVLTAIIAKYRPFLEVAGPAAIDRFLYSGERAKGESFANYIAGKEVARQEVENHLQEKLNDKVAGRVLLRQANLTEFQRELLALRDHSQLLTFDQVAAILRPLGRPELLAQAAGTSMGQSATKSYPVVNRSSIESGEEAEECEHDANNFPEDQEAPEDEESEFSSFDEEEIVFEDKVYDEEEAMYIQAYRTAYTDVRKDLRDRRKERGFVKHPGRQPHRSKFQGSRSASAKKAPYPRNNKGSTRNKASTPGMIKGKAEDLAARTRCYNCQELGHFARDCPLKGGGKGQSAQSAKKVNFVVSRGQGKFSAGYSVYMTFSPFKAPNLPRADHLKIYAGIRVKGCEAIVDTAAEDAVIGSQAFDNLCRELVNHGLRPVHVHSDQQIPCAGIGGEAQAQGLVDVPTSIAGLHGVLRFTVLRDSGQFQTPPLLPISYLEAVGAVLDFAKDKYTTADGYSSSMIRLPSGHRVIDILQFDRPWRLPPRFCSADGDPFRLPADADKIFGQTAATSSSSMPSTSAASVTLTSASSANLKSTSSANVLRGEQKTPENVESVEFMSEFLFQKSDFSYEALEILLDMLPSLRSKNLRSNVMHARNSKSQRVIGGAFIHGGVAGVTQFTLSFPAFCRYLNEWGRKNLPETFEVSQKGWTSFQVSLSMTAKAHRDSHNFGKNAIVAVGTYTGGDLWLSGDEHFEGLLRSKKIGNRLVTGRAVCIHNNPFEFSPKTLHSTLPWSGSRKTVTFYSIALETPFGCPQVNGNAWKMRGFQ